MKTGMADPMQQLQHVQQVENYFDSLAGSWEAHYAAEGSMRGRLDRFLVPLLSQVRPPAAVLDFGCGSGDLSAHLADAGYEIHGVDQARGMIQQARKRFTSPRLEFSAVQNAELPFFDGQFAACVSSSVLEYVAPLRTYLTELRRVVRKGGFALVTVPNPYHPVRMVESLEKTLWTIIPRTGNRWPEGRVRYLNASVNRMRSEKWRREMAAARWRVEWTEGTTKPLILIFARAV
jgi:ubiquinone/menaquinone biosynthesis C-methylase UbiE